MDAWKDVVHALWKELPPIVTLNSPRRPAVVGLLAPGVGHDLTGASLDGADGTVRVLAPGLANDAATYHDVLACLPTIRCRRIASEPAPGTPTVAGALAALDECDWVVAFEHLGCAAVVRHLRARRASGHLRAVVLVPNLETWDRHGGRWRPTLEALDVVTLVVAKTPSLAPLIVAAWADLGWPAPPSVLLVGHCSPLPASAAADWPAARTDVVHFAGCSGAKNTLENARAGVALVRRFRPHLSRLVVYVTAKWVRDTDGATLYALDDDALSEVQALVDANADVATLVLSDFMPPSDVAALYERCRLALCCSNAEGFGHYILEAAAHGCLVVTTDGVPMREVLQRAPTVALATPSSERARHLGRWYEVPASAIEAAAAQLPLAEYDAALADRCRDSYRWRQRCIVRGLAGLVETVG